MLISLIMMRVGPISLYRHFIEGVTDPFLRYQKVQRSEGFCSYLPKVINRTFILSEQALISSVCLLPFFSLDLLSIVGR